MPKLNLWARFMLLVLAFAINFLKWIQNPRRVLVFAWYTMATAVCLWIIGAPFIVSLVLGLTLGATLDYIIYRITGPR